MSRETMQHLNTQTLIGFTDKRGEAWHYRRDLQGDESNHYPGAIPVADLNRRLFTFTAESAPVFIQVPSSLEEATGIDESGQPIKLVRVPGRQAIYHSETGHTFEIFKEGYTRHQFSEWLIGGISNILGDSLAIGSAGVLKEGALAWVSVETPDSITTKHGIQYRPHVLATTAHDGSLSTTYKPVVTNVVCDNTHGVAMAEEGGRYKVKHSKYSKLKLDEARDALGFIHTIAEDFEAEAEALATTKVTDKQWAAFLDTVAPIATDKGRSQTMAQNKQDTLRRLWNHDERVTPWKNTAWGVVQAVNTYAHHEQTVRGATRPERNMLNAITGVWDKLDADTTTTLRRVLSNA